MQGASCKVAVPAPPIGVIDVREKEQKTWADAWGQGPVDKQLPAGGGLLQCWAMRPTIFMQ